jgi:hypothetical protein
MPFIIVVDKNKKLINYWAVMLMSLELFFVASPHKCFYYCPVIYYKDK